MGKRIGAGKRGRSPGRTTALLGAGALLTGLVAGCGSGGGTKINVYYAPEDSFQKVVDNCNKAANGRYEIVYNKLQRGSDDQRLQMARRLAAGDTAMDVLGLDVTWVSEFAEAGWVDEWKDQNKAAASEGVLQGPLDTATYNGKLYAAPKNTNIQLLWYDDRITPTPPKTWDEAIQKSQELKQLGKPYSIVFTGAQYEGLVVFYNTLVASMGGHILSDDGKSVVMDDGAVKALALLKKITDSGITDASLTNSKEDDVRQTFQRGDAAFELNWPFVYASYAKDKASDVSHFKWAVYPQAEAGTPAKTTIGGYDLAVSSLSQHKPEAYEAALCLRSPENQKFSAINDGVPPTIESVYHNDTPLDPSKPAGDDNPNMAIKYPMRDSILDALKDAAVRPLTPAYQNASTVMSKILSPPAEIDPQATADKLRQQLSDALQSKGVIP
ncbi:MULTISPECIES: ABC transporter substrate-binding protein [unclassified Amycolatopsis]|uniref:ABC transporter substrate-binding protein n=1 Tax=unclassified Amycolatopsis TaxID=2618356 RepID=UPI002E11455F|nr:MULTISPECIES: ABC transporter substrate-binding protein [unclassified Amycolatopsis]WSJ76326.1 ABC transporter substrate-binding protein [Amycolatopsis sp. NBC_01307]WSK80069.1 ABC transporter substrate-binding protein [Amycolatopsis sp. NBC_01286]